MKFFNREVQIALVAIVGVVVLFFGLQFLKGLSLFSDEDVYYVTFDDISGLAPSSAVFADGYKVGSVKDIAYDYAGQGKTVASISLNKNMRLPKGSTAEIETDMLGNVKVNLMLASNPVERVAPGDTITGGMASGMLGKAAEMIPAIEKMLPKLDSIMTRLNTLLADPSVDNTLHNVDKITANLTTTTAQLNTLVAGLNRSVPGMMAKADVVLDNTGKLTKNLSELDVAATMARVDQTLDDVHQMTERLNSGEGTLGLLLRDPGLYDNLNSTARSADSLLIDLRQHPKRYVHFSIFGRKDK